MRRSRATSSGDRMCRCRWSPSRVAPPGAGREDRSGGPACRCRQRRSFSWSRATLACRPSGGTGGRRRSATRSPIALAVRRDGARSSCQAWWTARRGPSVATRDTVPLGILGRRGQIGHDGDPGRQGFEHRGGGLPARAFSQLDGHRGARHPVPPRGVVDGPGHLDAVDRAAHHGAVGDDLGQQRWGRARRRPVGTRRAPPRRRGGRAAWPWIRSRRRRRRGRRRPQAAPCGDTGGQAGGSTCTGG